jgi:hypothetical protein
MENNITSEVWVLIDPKNYTIIKKGTWKEITGSTGGHVMTERYYEQYKREREELLRGV